MTSVVSSGERRHRSTEQVLEMRFNEPQSSTHSGRGYSRSRAQTACRAPFATTRSRSRRSPTHLEAGHIRDTQPHDEGDYRLERLRDPRCRARSHRAPRLDLGHPGEAARTAGNTRSFDHSVANEPCLAGPKAVRLYTETTKSFGARSWVTSACPFVNHVHANI